MAKVIVETRLQASNGSKLVFPTGTAQPCFSTEEKYWPLAEFEDLVKFVRGYIEEQSRIGEIKLSELDDERQTEG